MSPQTSEMSCSFQSGRKAADFSGQRGQWSPLEDQAGVAEAGSLRWAEWGNLAVSIATATQPVWSLALSYLSSTGLALT